MSGPDLIQGLPRGLFYDLLPPKEPTALDLAVQALKAAHQPNAAEAAARFLTKLEAETGLSADLLSALIRKGIIS